MLAGTQKTLGREPKSAKVAIGPAANDAMVPTGSQNVCEPYRHNV